MEKYYNDILFCKINKKIKMHLKTKAIENNLKLYEYLDLILTKCTKNEISGR